MSFPKKGRKVRPVSGKTFPKSSDRVSAIDEYDYTAVVAETLRDTFGGSRMAIKTVMAYTGAGERAVRNWFEAKNAPNGDNFVELVRHSDEVLEAFLLMAGRGEILSAKKLVDARDKLVEMLEIIDQLQGGDTASPLHRD